MKTALRKLSLFGFAFAFVAAAFAETDLLKVRFDQELNHPLPLDAKFVDESGAHIRLGDYFGKKPVVIVPGYYGCPMLCTVVANGLIESLLDLKLDVGRDFTVVHFSIDPHETPAEANAKKNTYIKRYGRPGASDGWHFLTGDAASIRQLSDAIGFHYVYDPATKQYAHSSGIVIATPEGKISRYFFGVNFPPNDLRLALTQASARHIGSPIDQLVLLCFHYNPITGKYGIAILNVLRLCGAATFFALVAFITFAIRRERARRLAT